jgi:1,4-alpha-glucan branching enzyme
MKKTYLKSKKGICKVTFKLPKEVAAQNACLVGDFNHWDKQAMPLKRNKNGSFSLALNLESGQDYRFRYWLDDTRWENDWDADSYVPNGFDSEDSVVRT